MLLSWLHSLALLYNLNTFLSSSFTNHFHRNSASTSSHWLAEALCSRFIHLFDCLLVTKLVNTTFWKRMNWFWYKLAQVVHRVTGQWRETVNLGVRRSKVKATWHHDRSQLENLLDRRGREWCLHQASKSKFGVMWPWSLTYWPQKLIFHSIATDVVTL